MMYRLEFTLGKDFFLLKVGVRSAARTGRDVTSITSGGAILPEQSLNRKRHEGVEGAVLGIAV